MTPSLSRSYSYCERVARREAGNFYLAFRVLPREQRLAMCALYAFLRIADDLSDGPQPPEVKRQLVDAWRQRWQAALDGKYSHRLHAAFHDTVKTYHIPDKYVQAVLDGVSMDLDPVPYETFADLYPYCYRVASAVGLACIHIWGFDGEEAKTYAEAAGIAFQMTNILRDLREDAARGRIYLPREDLRRFGYREEQLNRGERDAAFRALMRFEVERARGFYEAARPLVRLLRPAGRAVFLVMSRTYRGLLETIERRDYDVFSSRIRLGRCHKAWLAIRAMPVRWGWA
jgi:15-cis-phytoene synthase